MKTFSYKKNKYKVLDDNNNVELVKSANNECEESPVILSKIEKGETTYRLVTIGADAFKDCKSLKEISIPEGVKEIDGFNGCESLEKVMLPGTLKKIGGFSDCKSLREITIPEGVEEICGFNGCESLYSTIAF